MTTTVFISGGSQAVRIPKELRFDAKRVEIERRGCDFGAPSITRQQFLA